MIVRVHGARGSHPVPTTNHRIEELQKSLWDLAQESKANTWDEFKRFIDSKPRHMSQTFGGNTTCVEIQTPASPMPIFVDAGSGLTTACMDPESTLQTPDFLRGKGEVALFFSHTHWDHISGLVTIPQLFMENNRFHFYGVHPDLRGRMEGLFDPRYFPVPFSLVEPRFHFHQIALGKSLRLGNVKVDHLPQSHPGGSFAYRFSDGKHAFVMATDTDLKNTNPPHLIPGDNIYSNANVLFIDAHFSPEDIIDKEDFGHAHIFQAIDFGIRENAKMIYLAHQNPYYTDQEIQRQLDRSWDYVRKKYPSSKAEIRIAIDGDVLDLKKI
ncbi:MAG: MBL fold metallo-hydrolase [Bdellovibrionota bacterium]